MVTIRRYRNNRKLYDTATSRYVTLEHVATLVRRGEPIRVVDSETGEDITGATLAQVLFESERLRSRLPPPVLADLIRRASGARAGGAAAALPAAVERRLRAVLERFVESAPETRVLRALDARVAALEARLRRVERGTARRPPAARRWR